MINQRVKSQFWHNRGGGVSPLFLTFTWTLARHQFGFPLVNDFLQFPVLLGLFLGAWIATAVSGLLVDGQATKRINSWPSLGQSRFSCNCRLAPIASCYIICPLSDAEHEQHPVSQAYRSMVYGEAYKVYERLNSRFHSV